LHFVDPVIPKERCDQYVGPRFSWRGCPKGESSTHACRIHIPRL